MAAPVRLHVEVLGWLHVIWGGFGVLAGGSLLILAAGTRAAMAVRPETGPAEAAAVWILAVCGGAFAGIGVLMAAAGRALLRGRPPARGAALALTVPNLLLVPFGTALAVYTGWVLLNDDARRQFGHPPRAASGPTSMERG